MLHWRAVFECEPARKLTVSDGEPAADPMVRKRASALIQGRSFSGFRTAQTCVIRSPATSNAITHTGMAPVDPPP